MLCINEWFTCTSFGFATVNVEAECVKKPFELI